MKKGFTLIELLAVIVILAIIALIATPIILGIIKNAKEESNERSIDLYVKAAELAVARKNLTSEFKPTECTVEDGECTCDGETLNVEVENGKGINGTITFNDKGIVTDNTLVVGTSTTPTPVGEQYLYQWDIGKKIYGPTVGNTINLADYAEENGFIYSATPPVKAFYNKFKIEDNVVTEGYSCVILGGEEHCVRGGDKDGNSFYDDGSPGNVEIIRSIQNANPGSSFLYINNGLILSGDDFAFFVRMDGLANVSGDNDNCTIYGGGSSDCGK